MPAPPQTMRAQLPSLFGWHQIATGWSQRRPVSLHPTITFASWASPHGSPCQHWQRIPSIKRNSTRHETTTTGAAAHLQSLSDEQLAAVTAPPSGSHISVIAGPGSGKTRVLTARVAQLVREHAVPLQDILVITFTNKAADELKARLMRELGQQAELLTAGTFHSIAVRLLHADLPLLPRAGVSRRFKILDQEDALVLLSKILRELEEYGAPQPTNGANLATRAPAPGPTPDAKSRNVWLNRNVRFIAAGVALEGEFGIANKTTLTKARKCLSELIQDSMSAAHQVLPTTYRRSGWEMIHHLVSLASDKVLEASDVQRGIAKDMLAALEMFKREHRVDCSLKDLGTFIDLYVNACRKSNYIDFDRMLSLMVAIMHHAPGVVDKYRARYRYVLVDEFQDVNEPQFEIVRMLAQGVEQLFVVGDPAQAIYAWRGADPNNMRFRLPLAVTPLTELSLTTNYRSVQPVLAEAARLWNRFPSEFPHHGKLRGHRKEPAVAVKVWQFYDPQDEARAIADHCGQLIKQGQQAGEIAVLVRTARQMAELEFGMMRQGLSYRLVGGKNLLKYAALKDCMAYLQLTVHPSNDVLSLDRVLNTPPRKLGPKSEGMLKALATEQGITLNELLLEDIEEWPGPPPVTPADMPLPPRLADAGLSGSISAGLRELRHTICSMRAACIPGMSLGQPLRELLSRTEYMKHARATAMQAGRARRSTGKSAADLMEERVHMLLDKLDGADPGYEEVPALGSKPVDVRALETFLTMLSLNDDTNDAEVVDDVITISTIHGAKGLEWDVVFLPGMVQGVLPLQGSDSQQPQLLSKHMEERRLCYVAFTRAKNQLVCSYFSSARSFLAGKRVGDSADPSEFLSVPQQRPKLSVTHDRWPGVKNSMLDNA